MHRASIVFTISVIVLLLASCTDFDCPPNSIDKDNRCIPIKPDGDTSDSAIDGAIADADTRDRETPDGDDGIDDGGADARIVDTGIDASSCPASCIWGCDSGSCDDPKQITAGSSHTCALRDSGQVVCWGLNTDGQLGDGSIVAESATPRVVRNVDDAVQIGAGHEHTCAVRESGEIVCWGNGENGRLGDGTITSRNMPVTVTDVAGAAEVDGTAYGTNARDADGNITYWGGPAIGPTGTEPRRINPVTDVVSLASGRAHSCAATDSGAAHCWGYNNYGGLGNGMTTFPGPNTSVQVMNLSDAVETAAGDDFSCALREGGGVVCWGKGTEGQLGNSVSASSSIPVAVTDLTGVMQIDAGSRSSHVCVVRTSHEVMGWGLNDGGQLGDSTRVTRNQPVRVMNLPPAQEVAAGEDHSCARLSTNEIRCWGDNAYGQLGDGSMDMSLLPVRVVPPESS